MRRPVSKTAISARTGTLIFSGVMVTEELPAGTRVWVNVRKRLTRKGEVYVSVVLKRQKDS